MRTTVRYAFVAALVCAALSTNGLAQTVAITNGASGAGHLTVNVDAYGSYGNFNAAYIDSFEPTGSARNSPVFSAAMLLFSGQDRVALTSMAELNTNYSAPTWGKAVTTGVSNSGADRATSAFNVLSSLGAPILSVGLVQTVSPANGGSAILNQIYRITNVSGSTMSFQANRNLDMDLIWDGNFENDSVGAESPDFVYAHDSGGIHQGVGLSSGMGNGALHHTYYWAGKQGHTPTGGGPAMGFGTDVQVWNAFGLPASWQNYVPGVGYNMSGTSSMLGDSHAGLQWNVELTDGATVIIDVQTTYGVVPEPASLLALGAGALVLMRRRR